MNTLLHEIREARRIFVGPEGEDTYAALRSRHYL